MGNRRTKRKHKRNRMKLHKTLSRSLKQKHLLVSAKKHIRNFSDITLSDYEYLVLGKGLKFIPSPPVLLVKKNLLGDFNTLTRKMRCKYEFDTGNVNTLHPFYVKSSYTPPFANNAIETYLFQTKMDIDNFELPKHYSNLSKMEWNALQSLKKRTDIVIKKADKNSTIVVMNTKSYINQGEIHTSSIHYERILEPSIQNTAQEVKNLVEHLKITEQIDKTTYKFLKQGYQHNKCGRLYFLPKIHKLPYELVNNLDSMSNKSDIHIPGRPIISQCGSPTVFLGRLLDYFLLPLVKRQETYTRDSTDLLQLLEKTVCPGQIVLCTYDLTSMYTNMYCDELSKAVENAYSEMKQDDYVINLVTKNDLLRIVNCVLKTNEFEFEWKHYIQKIGCPMGSVVSPEISDIRAYELINSIIEKFPYKQNIILHRRFRDDGLITIHPPPREGVYSDPHVRSSVCLSVRPSHFFVSG